MPDFLVPIVSALIGLCSATFAGYWGWRLADRLPGEPSWPQCVYCQRRLRWYEMLPLFGWMLRQKLYSAPCSCGQTQGRWIQPVIELSGFFLGLLGGLLLGWSWIMVWLCLCLGLMPAIALIDLCFGVIPDLLNLLIAVFGLAWLFAGGGDLTIGLVMAGIMLIFGLALAVGYSKLRRKDMLGFGDVKFFAAAGLWLQPDMLPWFLMLAGGLGAIGGLIWKRFGGGEQSPFAPALVTAFTGCLIYQVSMVAFQ